MLSTGEEKFSFQGKDITVNTMTIRYNDVEMFRLKIYKDKEGYYFPVSIAIAVDFSGRNQGAFELRADKIFLN